MASFVFYLQILKIKIISETSHIEIQHRFILLYKYESNAVLIPLVMIELE